MGTSGAMIQRFFSARQYLHADQQVCIVAVNGHIISIEARAAPPTHTSSAAGAVCSADGPRGLQTDRTARAPPEHAVGNLGVVRVQPPTRQPTLWIEGL